MINFRCPKCNDMISVPESIAGGSETCPSCGTVIQVPGAMPVISAPPPAAPVQQVVAVQVPRQKSINGLGVAALVLGLIACLSCWIPFVGCVSVPFSVLAILFGGIGLLIALLGRKSGVGFPISGLIVGITAIVLFFVTTAGTAAAIGAAAQRAMIDAARSEIQSTVDGVQQYRTKNGKFPGSLKEVFEEQVPTDPWGNELQYSISGGKFRVWSSGPDKVSGTADDISS